MTENLHAFSERIKTSFHATNPTDETNVSKALVIYRQGRISTLPANEGYLKARISEVAIYHVQLDLQFPSNSTCSCGQLRICIHQLALFFYYYSQTASVSQWVTEWKKSHSPKPLTAITTPAKAIEKDVVQWLNVLRDLAKAAFHRSYSKPAYGNPPAIYTYRTQTSQISPIEKEWANLYRIFANLIALETIWDMPVDAETSSQSEQLCKQLQEEVALYSRSPIHFSAGAFHQEMLTLAQEQLNTQPVYAHEKWLTFTSIWSNAIANKKQKETAIQTFKEQPESNDTHWGLIHLFLENREDALALKQLQMLQELNLARLLSIIDSFSRKQNHHRSEPFIEWIVQNKERLFEKDDASFQEKIRHFSKQLRQFAIERKRFDLVEKFLRNYLPETSREYAAFLYNKGDYRKWVDLQLLLPLDDFSFATEEVSFLFQEHPSLLLPLYHQKVLQIIEVKKRTAYQQAAHHLKQLRSLYQRTHRLKDWKLYLSYLQNNFSNLTSFQKVLKEQGIHDTAHF